MCGTDDLALTRPNFSDFLQMLLLTRCTKLLLTLLPDVVYWDTRGGGRGFVKEGGKCGSRIGKCYTRSGTEPLRLLHSMYVRNESLCQTRSGKLTGKLGQIRKIIRYAAQDLGTNCYVVWYTLCRKQMSMLHKNVGRSTCYT